MSEAPPNAASISATAKAHPAAHAGPKAVLHADFPAFDVFRGIGILFVIAAHTPLQSEFLNVIRPLGVLGVHMFFALSGFLITFRLLEESEQTGAVDLAGFYRRRARRILPPALLYLAVLALASRASVEELAASLFFARNLYQPAMPDAWYTAHFWSLSLEEQFYLVWPGALVLLGPPRRRAVRAALMLIAVSGLWRIAVFAADPGANIYRPDLMADHLLWGCVIALLWRDIEAGMTQRTRACLGVAGILLAAILLYRQPPYWQPLFTFCVASGFILSGDAARGWTARLKSLRLLGKASYDCYIWQSLFLPLPWSHLALPLWQTVPWSYLGIAALTATSYYLTFPRSRRAQAS